MSIEVVMPQMGESIAEGTLVRWLKSEGDSVERDEPLFEISTDKVDTEIPSPDSGVLKEIRVQEGETVSVETVVAILDGKGNGGADAGKESSKKDKEKEKEKDQGKDEAKSKGDKPKKEPEDDGEKEDEAKRQRQEDDERAAKARSDESDSGGEARAAAGGSKNRQKTSPLVRRIAREHQVDLDRIRGTGIGGRVTKNDILSYIEEGGPAEAAPQPATAGGGVESLPFEMPPHGFPAEDVDVQSASQMRQTIARRMVLSKHVSPHVTTVHEVDLTEVARKIARHKEKFHQINGVKLTYLPFIVKAVVSGLREFPVINACLYGKEIHYFKRINVGIAVAIEDGLLVPVIRDAEEKSLVGQARAISDLAKRARDRKISLEELKGGTFTISNYGVFGSVFATPVINQPQGAILGVGAAVKRPVVLPDSDAIAVRTMSYFSLSFDHRLIDGATADQYLAHVKDILERCPYDPMES